MAFVELELRDPDNASIAFSATDGTIELDNTPPDVPVIAPLPTYSPGTTRTIYWSDESASGALGYCGESADNPGFDPIHMSSGCTPLLQATFVNLDDGQIYYYRVKCRDDLWNTSDWAASVYSTQDDSAPLSEAGPIDPYYATMAFTIPVTANDATSGVALIRLMYRVDGGSYVQFDGTFPAGPILFQADIEGAYDFYTVGTDVVGNVEDAPVVPDCSTVVDWTDPPAITDLEALPGHNRIHLSWVVPEGRDAPIEGTVIVRKPWRFMAYPEYDDTSTPLGYPAHPSDGAVVAFVPGTGSQTYDDESFTDATRNIYYYTAFAKDAAGNYSPAVASAQDRSTSYWLADVEDPTGAAHVYDGLVDYYDKVILSDSYYTQEGSSYYEAEMDVGPTDDSSRFGIPLTDNWIDFEDLMIVAMNYGRVDPSGKNGPVGSPPSTTGGPLSVLLERESGDPEVGDEFVIGIDVREGEGVIRGLSGLIDYDPAVLELVEVSRGDALFDLGEQLFFYGRGVSPGCALVDLAVLGPGRTLGTEGRVATLVFRVVSTEPTRLYFARLQARGADNSSVVCDGADLHIGGEADYSSCWLDQNVPNPFHPKTTIAFGLPSPAHATLRVYSVAGRLVRELLDEDVPAGRHAITWDGTSRDGDAAPSGVYLCVLDIDGSRLTKKLVLTK